MSKKLEPVTWLAERLNLSIWRTYHVLRTNPELGVVRIGRTVRIDPVRAEAWIANGGSPGADR